MKAIILLAIVGVIGVLIIAGIVGYQFIREQIQEQKHIQREKILSNYTLRDEYDKKFQAYANELTEKCNPNMVSSNSLNASEKIAMKQCADNAWENNGLADPKFNALREIE
jgi:Na+-translocating ferredoxin:NAD+ oxidoreductase RnfG subunit